MATIPGLSASSLNSYVQPASGANSNANPSTQQTASEQQTQAQDSVIATLSGNNSNANAALTYNASGLVNTFQQASANQPSGSDAAQAAGSAVLNAQSVITQTQGSLNTDSTQSSTNRDVFALLSQQADQGIPKLGTSNQSAQSAIAQAEYVKNQALANLNNSNTGNSY